MDLGLGGASGRAAGGDVAPGAPTSEVVSTPHTQRILSHTHTHVYTHTHTHMPCEGACLFRGQGRVSVSNLGGHRWDRHGDHGMGWTMGD